MSEGWLGERKTLVSNKLNLYYLEDILVERLWLTVGNTNLRLRRAGDLDLSVINIK